MSYSAGLVAKILSMQAKRKLLGEFIYNKAMNAESALDHMADTHPDIADAKKDEDYIIIRESLASIRAFLEELS